MLNEGQRSTLNFFMYLIAVILMVIRVDWWWYGKKVGPFVFGWLSYPMLYQLGIWLAGWIVVIITCKYLWADGEE